jgi:large subunit ribosomal protein L7/L12
MVLNLLLQLLQLLVLLEAGEAAVEEKTSFDVILKSAGGAKFKLLKLVKELTGLGLERS